MIEIKSAAEFIIFKIDKYEPVGGIKDYLGSAVSFADAVNFCFHDWANQEGNWTVIYQIANKVTMKAICQAEVDPNDLDSSWRWEEINL